MPFGLQLLLVQGRGTLWHGTILPLVMAKQVKSRIMLIMEHLHETEPLPLSHAVASSRDGWFGGYDGQGICGKNGKVQNRDHYGTTA